MENVAASRILAPSRLTPSRHRIMTRQPALLPKLVHTGGMTNGAAETPHPVSELSDILDFTAGLIAGALLTLVYLGEPSVPRTLLTLGFSLFVPGRAIVTNWPRLLSWSQVAVPIILSLSLLALLAMITLWARAWSPLILFQIEAWLSVAGLCLGLARRNRQRRGRQARNPSHGEVRDER
jgi:hypothetical protein